MDAENRGRRIAPSTRAGLKIRAATALVVGLALFVLAGTAAGGNTGSLTTIFASNNGNSGNTFDLTVLEPHGVVVRSLDVNLAPNPGANGVLGVYTRPGTAVGFEDTLDGWTLRDTAKVTAQGYDKRTPAPVSFSLPQGDYGVAVGLLGASPDPDFAYTDDTDPPTTFENDDLRLTAGAGLGSPLLQDSFNEDRIWNGTIYYSLPSCEFATQKLKKAKRQVRKAKRRLANAKASGDPAKIAKAEKKLDKKLKKRKKARRTKKRACS